MQVVTGTGFIIGIMLSLASSAGAQANCTADSTATAAAIRERLAQWVAQTNRGDRAGADSIWEAKVTGWFPRGPEFTDSAAYALAGLPRSVGPTTVIFEVQVDEVAVGAGLAAVHDIWKETRRFPGSAIVVTREIRGSELWHCQPDRGWRIRRWVSAPEHWRRLS
jgi:hypothetical protein